MGRPRCMTQKESPVTFWLLFYLSIKSAFHAKPLLFRPLSCRIEFGPWLAIQDVSICYAGCCFREERVEQIQRRVCCMLVSAKDSRRRCSRCYSCDDASRTDNGANDADVASHHRPPGRAFYAIHADCAHQGERQGSMFSKYTCK